MMNRRTPPNAPLPYINLEKYDIGDVDNSQIHVASAYTDSDTWIAPCVPSRNRYGSGFSGSNRGKKSFIQLRHDISVEKSSKSELSFKSVSSRCLKEDTVYRNDRSERYSTPPVLPPKGQTFLKKSQIENDKSPPVLPQRYHEHTHGQRDSQECGPVHANTRKQYGCFARLFRRDPAYKKKTSAMVKPLPSPLPPVPPLMLKDCPSPLPSAPESVTLECNSNRKRLVRPPGRYTPSLPPLMEKV